MKTIRERSNVTKTASISCIKYRNLKNISHFHSDYELIYVNSGTATVTIDENIFNLNAKQGAFIYSNDIHCITSDENTIITVLKISERFVEKSFSSRMLISPVITDTSYVENALDLITRELKSNSDYRPLMLDCIVMQFLITMFRKEKTKQQGKKMPCRSNLHILYHEIGRKIAAEYNTVTFEEMAEYMHFTKPYFSKIFHNIFEMTFTQYLNIIKIAAAIEKIKENKLSITEIAWDCGFNTIRNFNRVFKNLTGYAPNRLPPDYVFLYCLQDGYGLDPTLNCTVIIEE